MNFRACAWACSRIIRWAIWRSMCCAPMRKAELEIAAEMAEQAAEAVELIVDARDAAQAMNRFNRRVSPPDETKSETDTRIVASQRRAAGPDTGIEEPWKNVCTT